MNSSNDQPGYGSGNGQGGNGNGATRGPIIPKSPNEALKPERVPEPPRRSKKARSQLVIFLNFVMTMVVLVCIVVIGGLYYMIRTFQDPGPLETNSHFMVRPGNGLAEIANNLERNGVVSDARVFRYVTATYLRGGETLKAGEYDIKAKASMKDVMETLISGKSILYSVVFPEGLTVRQMMLRLNEDAVLEGDMPAELPAEGSLRPDTYKFSRGTKRSEILSQMHAAQQKTIDQIWEKRDPDLPVKTKAEFVVLASIVEKETGKDDERAHVASVFINRLNKGMRLQSDPTIVYGIFGGEGKPSDRPIYKSDLTKQTPYNTYQIKGLPPTPISNPGRAALEAVANPWRTNDLYFVADGTGGHVFAATLEEHNANVRRWRRIEAERSTGNAAARGEEVVDGQPDGDDAEKPPKSN
ncbi:endolytic transglycosylase MltG [Rhizobium sp. CFBP 8752]|uniref:endolytic transglycosylase MltG n=1 Tax=Rhizobium sp. CFBP 8752 TaxID=2775301 RepID=UPI00177D237F|nr:endolytic transglycosylase MltG [Rhizobium sp. CFBP 8752]MBD8663638.1 endolytic transglycosylase MltG [Rhizobium sp. CFBP 8752]